MRPRDSGTVVWVDLTTPGVEAAGDFYADLLGWTLTVAETDMGRYHVAAVADRATAGLMAPGPDEAEPSPAWSVYIGVDDLEHSLARITAAGGVVRVPPMDIPGGARIAVVADPAGAQFVVIGRFAAEELPAPTTPGALHWAEVMSRDPAIARQFYTEVFGWRADTSAAGGMPYTIFAQGDRPVAGLMGMPAEVPAEAPSHWLGYFAVADAEGAVERAEDLGGKVAAGVREVPGGRFAVLEDPAGAVFAVFEPVDASA